MAVGHKAADDIGGRSRDWRKAADAIGGFVSDPAIKLSRCTGRRRLGRKSLLATRAGGRLDRGRTLTDPPFCRCEGGRRPGTPAGVDGRRIPLAVKVGMSAFVAVLVPGYWAAYGPGNLLYFCDVAAIVTAVGLWAESPLLLGTQAVAVLVPQAAWVADFGATMCGRRLLGMTAYMFNPGVPRWVRGLSLFHGWLPVLLLWAVRRVGYDRRSLPVQIGFGLALLLGCYLAFAPPGTVGGRRPVGNFNFVYGPDPKRRQAWVPADAWVGVVMAVAVAGMFVPADLLLRRWAGPPRPARRFGRS